LIVEFTDIGRVGYLSALYTRSEIRATFSTRRSDGVQDNDRVVAWDVTWEKGKSTGMHRFDLDQVSVTLAEGAIKITQPDATWSIEQERFGSVCYEPKGTVAEEKAVNDTPNRAMVCQLKDNVPDSWPTTPGVAGQFPPINTAKLFETDRITVWDQVWKPGERVTRHARYHRTAAVFLGGGAICSISDSGAPTPPFTRKPGSDFHYQIQSRCS